MSKTSMPTPEPKPLSRTNSGSAIVFDPVAQRITTAKVSTLESMCARPLKVEIHRLLSPDHKPVKTAPKWFNHVDIYDEGEFNRLVATLNLGKLGWATSMKRLCGKCNDIYMMELPDEPTAPMATAY